MPWLVGLLAQTTGDQAVKVGALREAFLGNETAAPPGSASFSDTATSTAPAAALVDVGLGLPPETLFVAGVAALAFSKAFERRHGEVGGTLSILAGLAILAANVARSLDDGSPFAIASLVVLAWSAWVFVAYRAARLADRLRGRLVPPGPPERQGDPPADGDAPPEQVAVSGVSAASAALAALAAPALSLVSRASPREVAVLTERSVPQAEAAQEQEWRRSTWRTSLAVRFECRGDASGLGQAADVRGGAFYGLWYTRDRVQALTRVQVERAPGGGWTVAEHGTLERSSGPVRVAIENTVERGDGGAWVSVGTRMRAALNAAEGPTLTATVGAVQVSGGLPDASKGVVCAFGTRRWG
jgi:hypothetical protein